MQQSFSVCGRVVRQFLGALFGFPPLPTVVRLVRHHAREGLAHESGPPHVGGHTMRGQPLHGLSPAAAGVQRAGWVAKRRVLHPPRT